MPLPISLDENLITELAAKFDLRTPNIDALRTLITHLESGNYDPNNAIMLDLATGVGKTYVMAGFIEYLRRQDMPNVMIVTPNKTVQDKTVADFTNGSQRYIDGFDVPPAVITPNDVHALRTDLTLIQGATNITPSSLYIFNVQQLFPPKDGGKSVATGMEAQRRRTWRMQEDYGVLGNRLAALDNLIVIVDEVHLFGKTAKVYRSTLEALKPAATIGLTASSSKSDNPIFRYPLWRAINDGYVKQPVLVFRRSGYDSEDRQLQDALSLLRIKELAYEDYRLSHPEAKKTHPLLFVVCSDVAHATEVTERLRSQAFIGDHQAVLQVDNEHDDLTTQAYLRNLDSSTSPIRVIVSVNKLREGWDTKRIAVMCTLRAMASEVLTQQVMGRGLRLPFGAITGIDKVDELDIISHKSFENLLNSENVLKEFGIEDAAPTGTTTKNILTGKSTENLVSAIANNSFMTTMVVDDTTSLRYDEQPGSANTTIMPTAPTVGIRALTDSEELTLDSVIKLVTLHINPSFRGTTFLFPSSIITETIAPFELVEISTESIRQAAARTTDTAEHLSRTKITTNRTGTKLTATSLDRVAVPSFKQSIDQVRNELIKRVLGTGGIATTSANTAQLKRRIVPEFMDHSGVSEWTEKAKESAATLLRALVVSEQKRAAENTKPVTEIQPIELPVDQSFTLPYGKRVLKRLALGERATRKSTGFLDHEYYGPWTKGLFEAAAFDSFSGEYQLAELLNFDPDIVWWKRLYPNDNAMVYYTPRSRYIPDFVVLDTNGTYWIIEGKAAKGRDEDIVQKKRLAAERVIRKLFEHPAYEGQSWGYLLAYEDDIAQAESFADLLSMSTVERM